MNPAPMTLPPASPVSRSLRAVAGFVGLSLAVLLGGCATPPPPRDNTAFREAKPASVLVLPPINDSPEVLATPSVLSQLSLPLAESGYYVLPVALVDETLKSNGIQTASDAQQISGDKLRSIFGADAALYVAIRRYGSVYKVTNSEAAVTLSAKLVDLRSGALLWEGSATASTAEQNNGNTPGGLVGLLVKAVIEQIANNMSERSHAVAGIASQRLLTAGTPNGLIYGPRSPLYGK